MAAAFCQTMPQHSNRHSSSTMPAQAFYPPPISTTRGQYAPAHTYQSMHPQHAALEYPSPMSPSQMPPPHILQYLSPPASTASYSPHSPASAHSSYSSAQSPHPRSRPRSHGGRAVLIGINYFNQKGEMYGRVDEARNLHTYLTRCKHYRPEDIILLTDDQNGVFGQPTREHILKALSWLSEKAYPGEKIVVYYSGHGRMSVRGKRKSSSEKGKAAAALATTGGDDEGETMYPVDFRCFKEGMIKPEVLEDILEPCRRKGAKLTVILDTHGGVA